MWSLVSVSIKQLDDLYNPLASQGTICYFMIICRLGLFVGLTRLLLDQLDFDSKNAANWDGDLLYNLPQESYLAPQRKNALFVVGSPCQSWWADSFTLLVDRGDV